MSVSAESGQAEGVSMGSLASQLPALIGVVVGALLSYVGGHMTERSRWRREMVTRWDASQLRALTDYSIAIKAELRICLRLAAYKGLSSRPDPLDPETGSAMLTAAEDQRATQFESLLLLADPATVDAARRWQQAIWTLHPHVVPVDATGAEFLELFRQAGIARERFYDAARLSLGVGAGQLHSAVPASWGEVGDHKI
jgi:hypothetical protein